VLINGRVYLLLKKKTTTYRPRRTGERKRKSVRGCICGPDLAVISLKIVKKGEKEIEGLTDGDKPRRRGPKRANTIKKVFALRKQDDVRKYVVSREIKKKDKTFYKSPKIQRLITERRIRRKKLYKQSKKDGFKAKRDARAKYEKVLSNYLKEKKALQKKAEEKPEEKKPAVSPKKPETIKKPIGSKAQIVEKGKPAAPEKKVVAAEPKKDQPKKDQPKKDQPKGGKGGK